MGFYGKGWLLDWMSGDCCVVGSWKGHDLIVLDTGRIDIG